MREIRPILTPAAPRCGRGFRLLVPAALLLLSGLGAGCGDPVERALERDGLHVADLEVGQGIAAEPGDYLRVRYTTWAYRDGERGREIATSGEEPLGFLLGEGEVLPGWDTGLLGIQSGGKRRLVIAPDLVGEQRPRGVAADEALWSEITLVELARVQVRDLVEGTGRTVSQGDYLAIHYEGWQYEDGQKGERFVSSRLDGDPVGVVIGAGMVNRGLERGLDGMRIGGRRQVIVPPAMAYGKLGRGPVPPDATLLYEVEAVAGPQVAVEVVREGEGEPVGERGRVRIHLAGWVAEPDGTKGEQFQDSRTMGPALTIILGAYKIQPGLELGMRGMRPGEIRRLHVPADMAFGSRGYHRADRTLVPPDTDVIYEVELLAGT